MVAFDRESVRVFIPQRAWVVYHIMGPSTLDGVDDDTDEEVCSRKVLYVGASKNPRSRLLGYISSGRFPDAEMVGIERFQSSTAMARRERELTDESGQVEFGRRHAAWGARKPRQVAYDVRAKELGF